MFGAMRTTRGLLASMGATTCLILAGTIVLSLASGIVAFNGWPGLRIVQGAEQQALIAQVSAEVGTGMLAPGAMRLPVSTRGPLVSASVARPGRSPSAASRRRTVTLANSSPSPLSASSGAGAAPALTVPASPSPPAALDTPAAGEPVRRLGQTVDQTVNDAGKALGDVITPPATPGIGGAVQNTTGAVGDAVDRVAGVVGTVVDKLGTPPAG